MMNETIKTLLERRSIRAYRPEQIKEEELQAILEAGLYAPSGMGRQAPVLVAIQDPQTIAQLSKMNAKIFGKEEPQRSERVFAAGRNKRCGACGDDVSRETLPFSLRVG